MLINHVYRFMEKKTLKSIPFRIFFEIHLFYILIDIHVQKCVHRHYIAL
jgi:hypothetical protein